MTQKALKRTSNGCPASRWQLGRDLAKPHTAGEAVKEMDGLYCAVGHYCAGQFEGRNVDLESCVEGKGGIFHVVGIIVMCIVGKNGNT